MTALRHLLAIAGRGAAAAFEVVGDRYSASPLAAHALADRARDAYWLRAEKNAIADPEYAAIQARINERSPSPADVSDTSGYQYVGGEYSTQLRISSQLTPHPLWWPLATFVADRPGRRFAGHAKAAYQRATRGWADSDQWDLGITLCATLAGQLNHLADSAWGWPGPPDYPEYDEWIAALRTAADGLNGWATRENSPAAKATVAAVDLTTGEYDVAAEAEAREEEVLLSNAQDALRWVANNLRDLWD